MCTNTMKTSKKRQRLDDENPQYSIVIPAYNEENFIGATLRSLLEQDFDRAFEVVVCDNNSTDKTSEVATSYGARVVLETTRGVCAARQAGFEASRAPIVISTDADTTFSKHWLSQIDKRFSEYPDAVAIAGAPHFVDAPLWALIIVWVYTQAVRFIDTVFKKTLYISAANIAFKRSAFSGYNTKLTQGGDELYLRTQLQKHGRIRFDFNNPVFTSSRRLYRGFLYNIFVTQFLYYFVDYNLARFTHRSMLGSYPAFRTNSDRVLQKRNLQVGALLVLILAISLFYWRHEQVLTKRFESRIQGLEQRIKTMRRVRTP